jgi:hypothetical protein
LESDTIDSKILFWWQKKLLSNKMRWIIHFSFKSQYRREIDEVVKVSSRILKLRMTFNMEPRRSVYKHYNKR